MGKPKKNVSAVGKAFADMTPEEQVEYVAGLEKIAAGKKPEEVDTTFEADGEVYEFNTKSFQLKGEVVDVVQLLKEGATKKFKQVCADLIEMESGFITKK